MILANRVRHLSAALVAASVLAFACPASAQEISDSHMTAARAAISALSATDEFDSILPQAAAALKAELIQKNPDLQSEISSIVDEQTLALVPRRADLEKEIATIYAQTFSEEDLNGIATFYSSAPGKKLLAEGPTVTREVIKSVEIWQRGIARDLAQAAGEKLNETTKKVESPVSPAPAAPLTDGDAATDGSKSN